MHPLTPFSGSTCPQIKEIVGLNLTMANDIRELASTKDELTMRNQQLRDNARRLGDDVKGLEDIENQLGNVLQEQRKIIQESVPFGAAALDSCT